jgi:cytochrome b-561
VLLIVLSSTLKTYFSPDKPLLTWRTFPLHPFLMVLAFGFLSPVAAAAWKSYEHTLGINHQVVKLIHGVLMLAATAVGIAGVADMWLVHEDGAAAQKAKGWAVHFQSAHSYVGLATLILFVLQATGGVATFILPILGPSRRAKVVEPHRMLGAAAAQQAAMIAIITGILSLSGRGDNEAPKDVDFKVAAILALALCLCLGLVLKH